MRLNSYQIIVMLVSVLLVDSSEALGHKQGSASSTPWRGQCEREEALVETNHVANTAIARAHSAHKERANTMRPVKNVTEVKPVSVCLKCAFADYSNNFCMKSVTCAALHKLRGSR